MISTPSSASVSAESAIRCPPAAYSAICTYVAHAFSRTRLMNAIRA